VAPFCRTTDEVLNEILRKEKQTQRPKPRNKRLRAVLTRKVDDKEIKELKSSKVGVATLERICERMEKLEKEINRLTKENEGLAGELGKYEEENIKRIQENIQQDKRIDDMNRGR